MSAVKGRLHLTGLGGNLAIALLLLLAAWFAAGWFWRLAAPVSALSGSSAEVDPLAAGRSISERHLFGASVALNGAQDAAAGYRLLGVIASSVPGQGYAILGGSGKPALVVHEGGEIAPGIVLGRILPRSVEISRDGKSQTLALPNKQADASAR